MQGIKKPTDLIYDKTKEPWIGGPGTVLPFAVESFLSWALAIACLSVSGYHYLVATFVRPTLSRLEAFLLLMATQYHVHKSSAIQNASVAKDVANIGVWLPLMTHSREETGRVSVQGRCDQLVRYLQKTTGQQSGWTNQKLVEILRGDEIARRLASLAARPSNNDDDNKNGIRRQLVEIWNELLVLPEVMTTTTTTTSFSYEISIILPTYRERGTDVRTKLTHAFRSCHDPSKVEVLVIDAGECVSLREEVQGMTGWGSLQVLTFTDGGGRGPCLNFGANAAKGRLYTFCHSDTTLPPDWDVKIIDALAYTTTNGDDDDNTANKQQYRPNSCAFSFGIDTSDAGLNGGPYPPGVKAIDTTANLRTHMYSLPYGDQVLSVPADVFHYIGGYPDQCLMEDYELISLLRRRNALLPQRAGMDRRLPAPERLVIIGGTPALCSPRRWQKFGVLFVTYMNSKFVNLYASGLTADGLFERYYGRAAPKRSNVLSPWEVILDKVLQEA